MEKAMIKAWGWYEIKLRKTKRMVKVNGEVHSIWEPTKKKSNLKFIKVGDEFKSIDFFPGMEPKLGDTFPIAA